MKQSMEFERDPLYFKQSHEESQRAIAGRIIQARSLLPKVTMKEQFMRIIARMCIELDVDGHRPDIIITRAAMTRAAYEGRKQVSEEDMIFAAELTLGFRMRRTPLRRRLSARHGFSRCLSMLKRSRRKAGTEAEQKIGSSRQRACRRLRRAIGERLSIWRKNPFSKEWCFRLRQSSGRRR